LEAFSAICVRIVSKRSLSDVRAKTVVVNVVMTLPTSLATEAFFVVRL
jgi:hypothetical protein